MSERGSLFSSRPRFVPCARCHDTGMVEDDRCEDVCPECEGGVWRERESWRAFFARVKLPFGLRFKVWRWPFFYRDFPA